MICVLIVISINDKTKALKCVCSVIALYLGVRYDYMYDYDSYYEYFDYINSGNIYFTENDHMEYGWYLITRLFKPLGFFWFVFICSCLFAYGVYLSLKDLFPKSKFYRFLIVFGLISASSFSVISSAQRQMLVTSIFMIANHYLLYRKISALKDLIKPNVVIYYAIIFLCSFLHSSALYLLIIPIVYYFSKFAKLTAIALAVLSVLIFSLGPVLSSMFIDAAVSQVASYEHIMNAAQMSGEISVIATIMYVFHLCLIIYVLLNEKLKPYENAILCMYFLSIIFFISAAYVVQIFRLAYYTYIFIYLGLGIILQRIHSQPIKQLAILVYCIWIFKGAIAIFDVVPNSVEDYKTIFSVLF